MIVTGKGITNQFGDRREKCGMVWSVWLDEFAQLHLGKGICYERADSACAQFKRKVSGSG